MDAEEAMEVNSGDEDNPITDTHITAEDDGRQTEGNTGVGKDQDELPETDPVGKSEDSDVAIIDDCASISSSTPGKSSSRQSTPGKSSSRQSTPGKSSRQSTPKKDHTEEPSDVVSSTHTSPDQTSEVSMNQEEGSETGTASTGPTPEKSQDTISISSSAPTTPLSVTDKPKKKRGQKRGKENLNGEGEASEDDLLHDDVEGTESADEPIDKDVKDRLLQDPIDLEVEAGDLDQAPVKDNRVKARSGRPIKKPKTFCPDTWDSGTEESTPKRKMVSGYARKKHKLSLSGEVVPLEKRKKMKDEKIKPLWLLPFDHGWKREIVFRNTYSEGKTRPADVYYYTPSGSKLRSGPQISTYLEETKSVVTVESFTWIKQPISDEPHETVRYAGKSMGRPGGSDSPKVAKSPIMKKKNPFVRSPLSLKKAAIATALPNSPKTGPTILKFGSRIILKQSPMRPVSTAGTIIIKPTGGQASFSKETVVKRIDADGMVVFSSVKAIPSTVSESFQNKLPLLREITYDPKQPVAKKHTSAKRPRTPIEEMSDSLSNIAKKFRPEGPSTSTMPASSQRLCGLDCPGRMGVPPSLHCSVCMCMYHPECVGKAGHQRIDGYVCRACKSMNKKLGGSSVPVRTISIQPPAPIHIIPGPTTCITPGPPPLKAAPSNVILTGALRGPPPLRMAPMAGVMSMAPTPPPLSTMMRTPFVPTVLATSQPRTLSQTINLMPSMSYPNDNRPSSLIALAPPIPTQPPPPPSVDVGSIPSVVLPGTTGLSSIVSSTPTTTKSIAINMPMSVPKDVNGQILALPNNVTTKLNLTKPISLKVNGQRFVIPPNCFINTSEGAKVYLPQGYLPGNMMQGPTSPLSVNLSKGPETDGQVINISPYADKITNGTSDKRDSSINNNKKLRRSARKFKAIDPTKCFIQPLHGGFDCMLHIFKYLGLKDLLRVNQVCKTWKRVASQHCLWKKVQLRGCRISDWEKAAMTLRDMHTHTLDLRGLQHSDETNRTWQLLTGVLRHLVHLRHMDFGQCPGSVLHNVTDKIKHLEGLTAEFITDTVQEPHMWTTNVKLDIAKFAHLKQLELLKLRGVCGLLMPEFSFSGGLSELCDLKALKTLSLTTLRDVPEDEFSFLSSLIHLEELELGDISDWKPETYSELSQLPELRSLRLECGVDYKEGGLGEALLSLNKLTNLELIKFAVSGGLVDNLHKVKSLKSLSIWPDTEKKAALVNTCTMRSVSEMTSLDQLDWGIMIEQSSTINLDDSSPDSNDSTTDAIERNKHKDGVPILPENFDLNQADNNELIDSSLEYINVQELLDRLCNYLPDTKIRVFKVPIISASKS